jgi:hypothetical protein
MNTIVCNTLSGAVTEYTRHDFDSVTATHCAGVDGLFAFGGDNDAGLPITTELRLPATLRENTLKQQIAMVYLSMRGQGEARFTVFGPGQSWSYPFHCARATRRAARWARASARTIWASA